MAESEQQWHAMTAENVVLAWETDLVRGLSAHAVSDRRARLGRNELPEASRKSAILQFVAQFINPLVGTLLAAAVVAVVVAATESGADAHRGLSKYSDALAILLIVIVNAIIGFVQERRAEKALDALKRMTATRCRVVRDGLSVTVDAVQLVPGDIVELAEGDQIPADLRLVETASFETIESSLTGESESVAKDARKVLAADKADADLLNMAFSSTTAVRGHARAVVVATGVATRVGRLGDLMSKSEKPISPLEARLEDFGNKILFACVAISVALFVIGMVQGGRWHLLLLTAVSVAVAAIPEGLPAITTITLALGMQRMARRNAIVRKLPAVETLGTVGVICSDKTGTLTRNEMTVRAMWAAGTDYDISGDGYEALGEIRPSGIDGNLATREIPEAVRRTIEIGVVANTASLERTESGMKVAGDPTEGALLALGVKLGSPRESTIEAAKTALHIPFDSDRKRMTLVLKKRGEFIAHTKGAVESILPLCTQIRMADGVVPLDDTTRATILARVESLSSSALRVLGLAEREGTEDMVGPAELTDAERAERVEQGLTFVGMVGMKDPPRSEVAEAIQRCRTAGIRVVMITGDHQLTAEAIAKELGLWRDGDITVTGEELTKMPDQKLQEIVHRVRVFARVSPEHKLRIVTAFQARREVVAMTGDGVNDAPAISKSSIGIAMGVTGTDVAREAADMVLADDNFTTIVDAVAEGRAIFRNIQKSIFFLLSSNAGLCVTVFATSFFHDMPPLSPLQILWINLVTNGLPALALGVDPPEAGQMAEPPREPGAPFLSRFDWFAILGVGVLMGAATIAIYRLPLWPGLAANDPEVVHSKVTMVFTVLAISPLFHAFNCRSQSDSIFKLGWFSNRFLVIAVLISGAVHVLALVIPPLQPVFRSNHAWSMRELWAVVLLSAIPVPVIELLKLVLGKRLGELSRGQRRRASMVP